VKRKAAIPCRDVPGFVRNVCKRVLHKIIVDRDVEGAVEESKTWIRRLVSGKLSMAELVMTGGLWRVDDSDISRVAGEKHNLQLIMFCCDKGVSSQNEHRLVHIVIGSECECAASRGLVPVEGSVI
jgi:hypothetical protein